MATTILDGRPVIRTTARARPHKIASIARGQLLYVTRAGERFVAGNFPYIGELAADFELLAVEFLDPSHPVYALRPKTPLEPVSGSCFFAPRDSFVYPGGEYPVQF